MVRDLVKEGAVGRDHANDWVEDLVARSRRSAEHLSEAVAKEVKRQIKQLGLVSADEVSKVVEQFLGAARAAGEQTLRTVTRQGGAPLKASDAAGTRAGARTTKVPASQETATRSGPVKRAGSAGPTPAGRTSSAKAVPAKAVPATRAAAKTTARRTPAARKA